MAPDKIFVSPEMYDQIKREFGRLPNRYKHLPEQDYYRDYYRSQVHETEGYPTDLPPDLQDQWDSFHRPTGM